jgi:hydrogenase/urease accessory protein HupE
MHRTLAALALTLASGWAAAHEGHGPANPHFHASDLFGVMLAVGVAAAGYAWWRGRK